MKKILITLCLTLLLLGALLPATTLAQEEDGFDGEYVHHDGKQFKGDIDWTPFFRDEDGNGVDDIIDESAEEVADIFIKLESLPTDEDVSLIEEFVPEVFYKARYTNTIIVQDVEKQIIYGKLRYLDRVTFIEYVCDIVPFLDVSAENIKAKPNDLYHDVWEELGIIGSGVNIAILDGGSNDHETTADVGHVSLNDMDDDPATPTDFKFIAGWDFEILSGGEAINPHGDPLIGHGTHVAGTALGTGGAGEDSAQRGVAPGAQLIDVKTVSDAGFGGFLVPALEWCIDNVDTDWFTSDTDGIQVISMSLGTPTESDGSDTFSQTANQAVDAGMTAVVATGNDGNSGYISAPAAADKVVAVGATDDHNTVTRDDDTVAGYSNKGPRDDDGDSDPYDELKPSVVAPGTNIMAPRADSYGAFVAMSGTSMAAPHVSGVVALMLEANPELTPAQVKNILQASAEARGTPYNPELSEKYNGAWGYGIVDAYRATLMAQGYCDVEIEEVEVTNVDNEKTRIDEGDDVRVTVKLREVEGFDVESYNLTIVDSDTGTELDRISDNLRALDTKEHESEFRVNQGGTYNFTISVVDVDPQDIDEADNQENTTFYVNYLPHADIQANETEAMTLEEIRFDAGGSSDRDGTVKEYKFDFDDGEDTGWIDEPVTTHTYQDDGAFNIRLYVKDNVGAESGPYSDQIRINVYNRAPVADAGDDLTGDVEEEFRFKGTGTDKDGEITLYEWDFDGDGSYDWSDHDSGETTYTYEEPGSYRAKLRVTDDDDVVDTDTINVDVTGTGTENLPPIAEITEPEEGVVYFTDKEIMFDAGESYDPDGSIKYYTFSSNVSGKVYDKGSKPQVQLTVSQSGHHNITLIVEDEKEATDSTYVHIFIDAPPIPTIDAPEDGETYTTTELSFDGSSSRDRDGDKLIFKWTSDIDGVLYEGEEPTFTAELSSGEHTITLEVSDPYITKSREIQIVIEETANTKPSAVIDDPSTDTVYTTETKVFFNATRSKDSDGDPLTYIWSSDIDGEFYRGNEKTFMRKLSAGTHSITLTVSDGELSDEVFVEITVNAPPVAVISSLKEGDTFFVGNTILFDASGSHDPDSDGSSLTYVWHINEEEVSHELSFEKHFEEWGNRDISLVVEDEHGFQSQVSLTIHIISHSIQTDFPEYSSDTVRADPGETIIVQLEVMNSASITDHIKLAPLQGENTILTVSGAKEFDLAKNEKKIIDLEINVSKSAPEGRDEIGLTITAGEGDFAQSTEAKLAILVGDVLSFDISMNKNSVTVDAGGTGTVQISITNNGNGNAAFKISIEKIKNWKLKFSSSVFTIDAGETKDVTLTITAPDTIKKANQTLTVTFESGDFTEQRSLTINAGKMSVGGGDDDDGDSPGFEVGLMVSVLAIVALGLFRKRKREPL